VCYALNYTHLCFSHSKHTLTYRHPYSRETIKITHPPTCEFTSQISPSAAEYLILHSIRLLPFQAPTHMRTTLYAFIQGDFIKHTHSYFSYEHFMTILPKDHIFMYYLLKECPVVDTNFYL